MLLEVSGTDRLARRTLLAHPLLCVSTVLSGTQQLPNYDSHSCQLVSICTCLCGVGDVYSLGGGLVLELECVSKQARGG